MTSAVSWKRPLWPWCATIPLALLGCQSQGRPMLDEALSSISPSTPSSMKQAEVADSLARNRTPSSGVIPTSGTMPQKEPRRQKPFAKRQARAEQGFESKESEAKPRSARDAMLPAPVTLLQPTDTGESTETESSSSDHPSLAELLRSARLAQEQGRFDEAESLYVRILSKFSDAAPAWNGAGLLFLDREQFPEAVRALEMAVRLEDDSKLYQNNLGIALLCNGRVEAALKHFRVAVGEAGAHYNAGMVYHDLGKEVESAAQFRQALAKDPKFTAAADALQHLKAKHTMAQRPIAAPRTRRKPSGVAEKSAEKPVAKAAPRITPTKSVAAKRPQEPFAKSNSQTKQTQTQLPALEKQTTSRSTAGLENRTARDANANSKSGANDKSNSNGNSDSDGNSSEPGFFKKFISRFGSRSANPKRVSAAKDTSNTATR